ncbi:MAG: DUF1549 domain-containing protein, partial [Acidobacteriota bacterium]|nr:DUF1549 domain-containing protein [Acidobacteriota bacterium]
MRYLFVLLSIHAGFLHAQTDEARTIFVKRVRPILQEKCGGCHGAGQKLSGDLRLDTRESVLRGGKRGPAVVPNQVEKSLLIAAVEQTGALKMPPGKKLPDTDIAALRRWIELGAPWADATSEPASTYSAPDTRDTWELQPLKRTSPGQDAIDTFVVRKLQEKNLQPAPPADRVTLIRRATFDLIGLPPTPEEVQAFVKDTAADREAFGKVIDRLLASPRYGERWGRHWLDVVRYADTGGYSNDFERPNAWRYRDYVIRSFNRDKPYDRFVREQIAGDEIDSKDPENLIATGFLRMGPWEQTGMSVAAETRQAWLDDVTHSTAATF